MGGSPPRWVEVTPKLHEKFQTLELEEIPIPKLHCRVEATPRGPDFADDYASPLVDATTMLLEVEESMGRVMDQLPHRKSHAM